MMGLQALTILTEGIWASLTGGWYYDKKQSHFSNLFHLYMWLIFLCTPFIIYLFMNTFISWLLYCMLITTVFTVIKLINEYFHRLFDTGKCIKDDDDIDSNIDGSNDDEEDDNIDDIDGGNGDHGDDGILMMMNQQQQQQSNQQQNRCSTSSILSFRNHRNSHETDDSATKDRVANHQDDPSGSVTIDHFGHRNEMIEMKNIRKSNAKPSKTISDNDSNELIQSKIIDLKADVHAEEYSMVNDNIDCCPAANDSKSSSKTTLKSSFGNLSLLFRNEDEPLDMNEDKDIPRAMATMATESTASDGHNDQIHSFRRARSEIQTTKTSNNHRQTPSVATNNLPSNPVSMEMITRNSDGRITAVDKNKFRQQQQKLNEPQSNSATMLATTSSSKDNRTSATYINDDDTSDDGDCEESELSSLCCPNQIVTNTTGDQESKRAKSSIFAKKNLYNSSITTTNNNGKQSLKSKQRLSNDINNGNGHNNRTKRSKSSTIYYELDQHLQQPSKSKSSKRGHQLLKQFRNEDTSDDDVDGIDDIDNGGHHQNSNSNDFYRKKMAKHRQYRLSSSSPSPTSSIPSSTSSSSSQSIISNSLMSSDNTGEMAKNIVYPINYPSTSSGVVSGHNPHHNRFFDRKKFRGKYSMSQSASSKAVKQSIVSDDDDNDSATKKPSTTVSNKDSKSNSLNRDCIDNADHQIQQQSSSSTMAPNSLIPAHLLKEFLQPGTHLATSHEDTSIGSVHVFQDEHGNWFSYVFEANSYGLAKGLCSMDPFAKLSSGSSHIATNQPVGSSKSSNDNNGGSGHNALIPSTSIFYLNNPLLDIGLNVTTTTAATAASNDNNTSITHQQNDSQTPATSRQFDSTRLSLFDRNSDTVSFERGQYQLNASDFINSLNQHHQRQMNQQQLSTSYSFNTTTSGHKQLGPHHPHPQSLRPKPSYYYELNVFRLKRIKIRFDRLALLSFLDRNITILELIISILLALAVSIFTAIILNQEFFHDIRLFVFCFVVAGSHYTLLKSVQPDAASPTHGFNRIAIYSRPIYFCLLCSIILASNNLYNNYQTLIVDQNIRFRLYGHNVLNPQLFWNIFQFSKIFLLIFPLLFVFGLLPQVNTFIIYCVETIDIHVFGGTSITLGIGSAIYSFVRSIISVVFLYYMAILLNIRDVPQISLVNNDTNEQLLLLQLQQVQQRTTFSIYCAVIVTIAYLLSRHSSNPLFLVNFLKNFFEFLKKSLVDLVLNSKFKMDNKLHKNIAGSAAANTSTGGNGHNGHNANNSNDESGASGAAGGHKSLKNSKTDPINDSLNRTIQKRYEADLITCVFISISVFSIHVSSIFKFHRVIQYYCTLAIVHCSFVVNYLLPQLRKQLPWLLFTKPILKSYEYSRFEILQSSRLMWYEWLKLWLFTFEKYILFIILYLSYLSNDYSLLIKNYGPINGLVLMIILSIKFLRMTFNNSSDNYVIIIFTYLFFNYDIRLYLNNSNDNIYLMNFFIMSFLYYKITDFLLKFRFVITYVAPWQITWGSAFHAFAQPFSVPHSALLMIQIFISSLLSAPLQPILGSAIFFTSYVRPIKFWERDYNTKRVDHSNIRLASQIDRAQIGSDDNNLNSIFYEHLTLSLQQSLYGDLILGRWGNIAQGDCFVMASDNLNCLVHIIEFGNGFVTFQVRGLEFRGTYCQQREVEAITEDVCYADSCCDCQLFFCVNGLLSLGLAFNQRWLSWEVINAKYICEGYSISEHIASTIVQPFDLRKALITYYVKSIIYFTIVNDKFLKWIENTDIRQSLAYLNQPNFVDLDPTFNYNIDDDYDIMASGITRHSFYQTYADWIKYCLRQRFSNSNQSQYKEFVAKNMDPTVSLLLGLSLLARRALGQASHHNSTLMNVEFFLYGFHALFKGDFRIHCQRDEWVFQDIDLLDKVVAPSIRMSLKLHQDHFYIETIYDNHKDLYESIQLFSDTIVISHEADPVWRQAILSNVQSLLALRHVFDEGNDQYKVIKLNKRFLNFRIIKINRECVRGLWAGQQQELIFLRNRNSERGSIQNAKQVLRNIINSSCDQPIGYPIYVSPLTTSFAETSEALKQILGPSLSFSMFRNAIVGFFNKIRNRCTEVCTVNSGAINGSEMNNFPPILSTTATKHDSLNDSSSNISSTTKAALSTSLIHHQHQAHAQQAQSQIIQMTNYQNHLKKRLNKLNADDEGHNRESTISTTNVTGQPSDSVTIAVTSMSSKSNLMATISHHQSDHGNNQQKALIIEKGFAHTKGDAV